jgi:hypothetical protein
MNLYIDIETIPTQRQDFIDDIAATIERPKTMSKPETIAAWEENKKPAAIDEAVRKTVFDGGMGEIITFGFAVDNEEPETIYRDDSMSEAQLLEEINEMFYSRLHKNNVFIRPVWVGHNICGYDLRFLWKRFIVNGIRPAVKIPYDSKPWGEWVCDTMYEWAGASGSDKKSLDFVCRALGLDGKDGFDGSMVYDAWKNKEFEKISEYCKDDVSKTREIHNRFGL